MDKNFSTASKVFEHLEGIWQGAGRGGYPTTNSFKYREKLVFTRRDESTLAYEQHTEKCMEGSKEFVPSHWESGFIRILENDELEMVNVQSGGRGEVLTGHIEETGSIIRLHFVSKAFMNDTKIVSSVRRFELDSGHLHYEMEMSTTRVDQITQHLIITLERVRK